jgi:hypothetical protein
MPPTDIAERIEAFRDFLPFRADTLAVAGLLARKLYEHRSALWPEGVPAEVEADEGAWFAGNVSATLSVLADLYRQAEGNDDQPPAMEFLDRMSWLPDLIDDLGQPRARLDA